MGPVDVPGMMLDMDGFAQMQMEHGTCVLKGGLVASGATPVKNW